MRERLRHINLVECYFSRVNRRAIFIRLYIWTKSPTGCLWLRSCDVTSTRLLMGCALSALTVYPCRPANLHRPPSTRHSDKTPSVYLKSFRGLCCPDYLEQDYWFSGCEESFTYLPTILVMQWRPLSFHRTGLLSSAPGPRYFTIYCSLFGHAVFSFWVGE